MDVHIFSDLVTDLWKFPKNGFYYFICYLHIWPGGSKIHYKIGFLMYLKGLKVCADMPWLLVLKNGMTTYAVYLLQLPSINGMKE